MNGIWKKLGIAAAWLAFIAGAAACLLKVPHP